jgi:hypothetical protein
MPRTNPCRLAALLLAAPAYASVSNAVTIDFIAASRPSTGQPIKIAATLTATTRQQTDVYFSINATSEWRIASGPLTWAGKLAAGEKVTLDYVATPASEDVAPLSARVIEAGQPEWNTVLQYASAPRVAKQGARPRASSATRTVSGRIAFLRRGVETPLRRALVELLDNDTAFDDQCGSTTTDDNGNFTVSGTCSDPLGNAPDFFLRVSLTSSALELRTRFNLSKPYQFDLPMPASQGQTLLVGGGVSDNEMALTMFNSVTRAFTFIKTNGGVTVPKATVDWPTEFLTSRYNHASKVIHIVSTDVADLGPFTGQDIADYAVAHEYGHHVMDQLGQINFEAHGTHATYTPDANLHLAFVEKLHRDDDAARVGQSLCGRLALQLRKPLGNDGIRPTDHGQLRVD